MNHFLTLFRSPEVRKKDNTLYNSRTVRVTYYASTTVCFSDSGSNLVEVSINGSHCRKTF